MPGTAGTGGTGVVVGDGKSHNITWVSRYWVDDAKSSLSGGFGMAEGLSYLALQFWVTDGGTARLSEVSEENVNWFRDWGKQNNVKVLLCLHNDIGGSWNWGEGVRSFKDNKDAFVQSIVSQVQSRNLDGVDVDIEGVIESTADDQASYLAFMQALSAALKPMGKTLTLASFHGPWNAPNWNWWDNLFPVVDGITSMGYEQSGMDTDYQDLVNHAATAPEKLMIGVPSYHGSWPEGAGNHSASEHLSWIQTNSKAGVAIWEAGLRSAEWKQPGLWQQLKAIKSR
jgi:GH18 family chitinase